jgi:hypothetical protein
MTVQINDRVFHRQIAHSLVAVSVGGAGLFNPTALGFKPVCVSTASFRGYHLDYTIQDSGLVLTALDIGLGAPHALYARYGRSPIFPGHWPVRGRLGHLRFEALSIPVPFTGGLLLGHEFIHPFFDRDLYFQPIWRYQNVRELLFENGRVVEDHDRSSAMAEIRARYANSPQDSLLKTPDSAEAATSIQPSFLLDYTRPCIS